MQSWTETNYNGTINLSEEINFPPNNCPHRTTTNYDPFTPSLPRKIISLLMPVMYNENHIFYKGGIVWLGAFVRRGDYSGGQLN